jgi:hypothetical protein
MLKIIATIGAIQMIAIAVMLIRSKTIAVLLGPEGVGVISIVDQGISREVGDLRRCPICHPISRRESSPNHWHGCDFWSATVFNHCRIGFPFSVQA